MPATASPTTSQGETRSHVEDSEVTMTTTPSLEEKFRQLAEPFDTAQIGKKPKGKARPGEPRQHCRICGGYHEPSIRVHLDFVGHAVVTHRLNTIAGPGNWSYTVDRIVESGGHVQAVIGTMTVLGRTIGPEVGEAERQSNYGEELKAAISDYIRRAAMRFGMALDLWARQDLERPEPVVETEADAAPANTEPQTTKSNGRKSSGPAGASGQRGQQPAADAGKVGWPGFRARCRAAGITEGDARALLANDKHFRSEVQSEGWQARVNGWDAEQLAAAFKVIAEQRGGAAA